MVTYIVVGVVVAAAVAAGVYVYLQYRSPKEQPIYHFRCPQCDKKLRYTADRAGRPAVCPRCRHVGPLPLKPQEERGPHKPRNWKANQSSRTVRA